jgi:uncharacterized protein YbjT (DUF2867 family)
MRVIITGATGMVGEGVLLECLASDAVTEVLSVSRRPLRRSHPKLTEYIVPDFLALKPGDEQLQGYDACFFCAGVSSIGKSEDEYRRSTYDTTLTFAKALEPKASMTFIYVSGSGTDSSERGRSMWARVKGKTENDLIKLPFKRVFAFRPAMMIATEGQRNVLKIYKYVGWILPLLKRLAPGYVNTMHQVAQAMINAARFGYDKQLVEVRDITVSSKEG